MVPSSLKRKLLGLGSNTRTRKAAKKTPRKKTKTKKSSRKKRVVKPFLSSATTTTTAQPPPTPPVVATNASQLLEGKVEFSPNAMAKCQSCQKKIQKNHKRYGIPEYSARYSKDIYRYYHVRCCPPQLQNKVPNAEIELARQMQEARDNTKLIQDRKELYDKLKRLRLLFANRLEVSFFLVFNNEVLKELVVKMPTTSAELLKVRGIGPTKLKSFGDPILTVIRQYNKAQQAVSTTSTKKASSVVKSERTRNNKTTTRKKKTAPATVEVISIDMDDEDEDEGDDDDIVMGASLTCEQLVAQKFAHAEQNGYIIAVD